MTLRLRLFVALLLAALVPMALVVGYPLFQAERRAKADAERRLDLATRQAAIVAQRQRDDVASRLRRAADDLARDPSGVRSLVEGPDPPARAVARGLAERHGLRYVEVLGAAGTRLAVWPPEGETGLSSALASLSESALVVRPVPGASAGPAESLALFGRRAVTVPGGDALSIVGGRLFAADLLGTLAAISGEPVALVDENGSAVAIAGGSADGRRAEADVAVGDGFAVRVAVAAGDAAQVRRDTLAALAGVAGIAVALSVVLALLLAAGVTGPVRALVARAEEIAAAKSRPITLLPERDEVRRLTRAFDQMLDALSESERQRIGAERIAAWQEVARRIAHEVKNPLTPIRMAVENLRRTRERSPADLDRALDEESRTILEEVDSLRRLVDEFSEFARLPSARLGPCDLRTVAMQALALFEPRIEALDVALQVDDGGQPLDVIADAEQIGRVLKNVIANALDAMESAAERRLTVILRIAPGSPGREAAEIVVRDTGAGFEPEALRRVFEPYFTTRGDRGGTGLGMAIAYRIVSEHRGTIRVGGAPGRGATIAILLPR